MALSRRAWVGVGQGARLLMAAFLAAFLVLSYANHVGANYGSFYELQSYTYAVAVAFFAAAVAALQVPVAVYLLCRPGGLPMTTAAATSPDAVVLALSASMYADTAASVALASGVGAGLGATNDAMRMVDTWVRWGQGGGGGGVRRDLDGYFARGAVALVFLLVALLLSVCAGVISARLRARAGDDGDDDLLHV